jgi:hypothetical protein
MAEYYAVLSKAVAGLESNGADTRRAVYDKARNALIGQLKAIEPPLPTAEISRQRLELEEAIRRVEREAAASVKAPPRTAAVAARAGGVPQRAQPQRAPKPSAQDVFRRAIQEAESTAERTPPAERAPVAARADDWSVDETADPPAQEPEQIEPPRPAARAPLPAARALPARKAETYLPSQGYVEEPPRPDEPRLAPDYDYEWDPDSAPKSSPGIMRDPAPEVIAANDFRARPRRQQQRAREDDDDDHQVETLERRARPSSVPTILLLVLIAVMLIGLAALAWSQRAVISDLLGGFDSHQSAAAVAPTPSPAPDTSGKDSDSLLGSNQDSSGDTGAPANSVRVVTPDASQSDNAATAASAPSAPADAPAPVAAALVAQKATLYEEPLDATAAQNGVVAIKAAVTWSAVQGSDGPQIVGNIDIPDRGMKLKMTFRQNHDKTLPASHVVEVVAEVPPGFPGKSIQDVPRIVMKPAEDARGEPLIGASAKVADGFFWIALSNVDADLSANLGLLKQREWFDLPMVYETGQRAIITLEKGTSGDRVFDQVLSAWSAGG